MAEPTNIDVDVNDLARSITVHISIKGCTKMRIKMYIGGFLIRLGIRIIGVNGKVELEE